jgi:hypothetical protein
MAHADSPRWAAALSTLQPREAKGSQMTTGGTPIEKLFSAYSSKPQGFTGCANLSVALGQSSR